MSETRHRDPLLAVARTVVGAAMGLMAFSGLFVCIGLGAVLTVERGDILARLAAVDIPGSGYVAVCAALILIFCLMAIGFLFMRELLRIIGSVEEGDPFMPANADRLGRMGWLALASQLLLLALAAIAAWFDEFRAALIAEDAISLATGAIVLTLVLFILARVFRVGAAMREDLKGTV